MDASTVIAVCATVVAVASLAVSVYEGRAARRHNRHSVRPLLTLSTTFTRGRRAGLSLTNSGLGPAVVTGTVLMVDGEVLGAWDERGVNRMRDGLAFRPHAATFGRGTYLTTDYDEFLLSVDEYDPERHAEFRDQVRRRLSVEIRYDSLYGGEGWSVSHHPS